MKNVLVLVLLAALAWYGYGKYQAMGDSKLRADISSTGASSKAEHVSDVPPPSQFNCDGRTHCSAMTSCAEATYFIRHCPHTEMDGNHDGVPCEKQWCR